MIEAYGEHPDTLVVLDMEASVEHLSRGTLRHADALLAVAEPYYRSLETVARVVPLAAGLGVPRVWVVANKLRGERDREAIGEYCARHGFEIIGEVPFDESVTEADRLGRSLLDHAPQAAAVAAVQALADTLIERLAMPAVREGQAGGKR